MHTPRPWLSALRPDGSRWLSLGDPGKGPHYQGDLVCTDEDAALICAAPYLLEALKGVMALIESGQLVRNTSNDANPDWAMRQIPLVMALKAADSAIAKAEATV